VRGITDFLDTILKIRSARVVGIIPNTDTFKKKQRHIYETVPHDFAIYWVNHNSYVALARDTATDEYGVANLRRKSFADIP
jgi:hypothetical protein